MAARPSSLHHHHACGCSKCGNARGAPFSIVGLVPGGTVSVTTEADRAKNDPSSAIQRHDCDECEVYLYGRIELAHTFRGLDLANTKLCEEQGGEERQLRGSRSVSKERHASYVAHAERRVYWQRPEVQG